MIRRARTKRGTIITGKDRDTMKGESSNIVLEEHNK